MIKLFSLKDQKNDGTDSRPVARQSAAQLRIIKGEFWSVSIWMKP